VHHQAASGARARGMTLDHRIRYFARPRREGEPAWLGEGKEGLFIIVCEVDDTPVYRDINDRWTHWQPGDDPARPVGQQEMPIQEDSR
jgi:hypothetical protein